jgi:hypothetical protein
VTTRLAVPRRVLPSSPFARPPLPVPAAEHVAVNDRVTHDRLGLGRVVQIMDDVTVAVDFGTSVVCVPHVKLTKL